MNRIELSGKLSFFAATVNISGGNQSFGEQLLPSHPYSVIISDLVGFFKGFIPYPCL